MIENNKTTAIVPVINEHSIETMKRAALESVGTLLICQLTLASQLILNYY